MAALGACAIPLGALQALREKNRRDACDRGDAQQTCQFVRHRDHPSGHSVTLVEWAGIRSSARPLRQGTPAPKYGADTRSGLTELGYRQNEIEAFCRPASSHADLSTIRVFLEELSGRWQEALLIRDRVRLIWAGL